MYYLQESLRQVLIVRCAGGLARPCTAQAVIDTAVNPAPISPVSQLEHRKFSGINSMAIPMERPVHACSVTPEGLIHIRRVDLRCSMAETLCQRA
jgi:hypothetical protein